MKLVFEALSWYNVCFRSRKGDLGAPKLGQILGGDGPSCRPGQENGCTRSQAVLVLATRMDGSRCTSSVQVSQRCSAVLMQRDLGTRPTIKGTGSIGKRCVVAMWVFPKW